MAGDHGVDAFPQLENSERVVLLIDVSRSMSQTDYPPRRLDAAKQAALGFIDKKLGIDDADEVAIVVFARSARKVCGPLRVGTSREPIQRKITSLKISYGGTRISKGLEAAGTLLQAMAHGKARVYKGGKKNTEESFVPRIILLSDGENLDGTDPIQIADQLKKAGVFINTIGIGERGKGPFRGFGLDEKVLQAIASPGRYRYIGDTNTLLFHFEGLAEKVISDNPEYASKVVSADDAHPLPQVTLASTAGIPATVRSPGRLARQAAAGLTSGLITAAALGSILLSEVLGPLGGSWAPAWAGAGVAGLLVTWSVRLTLRGAQSSLAIVTALATTVVALGLGLYIREPAVSTIAATVIATPIQYGIVSGIAVGGVGVGLLWKPSQLLFSVGRLAWPVRWVVGWRSGLANLKSGSPYLGQVCPNEKDQGSRLRSGDLVVVCPECGRPHHADCWVWNDNHCFGGDTPCSGQRRIPKTILSGIGR